MAKRARSRERNVARYILASDNHEFIGRIYDLSIAGMWFDTYEEAAKFPDVIYALNVNERTTSLAGRIESLNRVGNLLWPTKLEQQSQLPMSSYDWLNLIADLFLVRLISVSDCCMLLCNEVFELGLKPTQCKLDSIKKRGASAKAISTLKAILDIQEQLRAERNFRVHEGGSYSFTDNDGIFRPLAQMNYYGGTEYAQGPNGEKIFLDDLYREAQNNFRKKFNMGCRALTKKLPAFYNSMHLVFNTKFSEKRQSHDRNHPIYGSGISRERT